MRLIHTSTHSLHEFHGENSPPYAILSHTWGEEEVTFRDFEIPGSKTLAGYSKISKCCALARSDGWEYLWVDTCCIDKSSSTELSEAINSMYQWYLRAEVCYAYLSDVTSLEDFPSSRWFRRGWTLQELLAPEKVLFYNGDWRELGTRRSLENLICSATAIDRNNLLHFGRNDNYPRASVAQIMSWAARRETTRLEDRAYSLMGLFDINMPLLYGEGMKAFRRLQEMILRQTSDESLFAWRDKKLKVSGLLAQSPDAFADSGNIRPRTFPQLYRRPSAITNRGVEIDIHTIPVKNINPSNTTNNLPQRVCTHFGIIGRFSKFDNSQVSQVYMAVEWETISRYIIT